VAIRSLCGIKKPDHWHCRLKLALMMQEPFSFMVLPSVADRASAMLHDAGDWPSSTTAAGFCTTCWSARSSSTTAFAPTRCAARPAENKGFDETRGARDPRDVSKPHGAGSRLP
jgi:hypothetical protein